VATARAKRDWVAPPRIERTDLSRGALRAILACADLLRSSASVEWKVSMENFKMVDEIARVA
jgi:hypothetical protein